MLRRNALRLAVAAGEKKKSLPWPVGGAGPDRNFRTNTDWQLSVLRRTNDGNRFANASRYSFLFQRLNLPEDQAALAQDLRRDDFRKPHVKCGSCGRTFQRTVKSLVHHGHHTCHDCVRFSVNTVVVPAHKQLAAKLLRGVTPVDDGVTVDTLYASSKAALTFKCVTCQQPFKESVRARTKVAFSSSDKFWSAGAAERAFDNCPSCRFTTFAAGSRDFIASLAGSS
jgi:DNA-directed RNA polymerase subunit RPC12/RpoP